jgi:tetratricopeptide (TPR) repeat protein
MERFLLKTLSKDRADRFQSIEEMMAGLNRAVEASGVKLTGSPSTVVAAGAAPTVAAAPRPAAETVAAPAKPSISPLAWIGLGALIVIAVLVVFLATRPRQTPASPPTAQAQQDAPPTADKLSEPGAESRRALEEATGLFRRASDLVIQSRPDEARETFSRAAERAEQGLELLPAPGDSAEMDLQILAAESWLAAGNPGGAEPHARWLAKSLADKGKALSGLALTMLLQGRAEEASRTADEALAHDAESAEAHAVKACALLKSGERLAAAREFRLAVENASGAKGFPPWLSLVLDQLDCRLER